MIAINLTAEDIMQLRFAFSPILEAVVSYHMLHKPSLHTAQFMPWIDEANRALQDVSLPYMDAMIAGRSYIPDFLTPTPTAPGVDFEEDLKRLNHTPLPIVEYQIQQTMMWGEESELLCHALAHPRETIDALIGELRLYWQRTLEHHWGRITMIVENDVLYRARQLALYGAADMLNGLHPQIGYEDGQIILRRPSKTSPTCACGDFTDISGRGFLLVPAVFSFPKVYWQTGKDYLPMFIYGARGTGLWHYAKPEDPEEALQIALGVARARVLYALETPRSTGELAYLLDITSGAVSQHLSKMSQAGLVESSRSGKRVFYRLSPRGQQLIEVFT